MYRVTRNEEERLTIGTKTSLALFELPTTNMDSTVADNTFDSLLFLGAKYANFFIFCIYIVYNSLCWKSQNTVFVGKSFVILVI